MFRVETNMAVIEETPEPRVCPNCNASLPFGWKVLVGKAKCRDCGKPLPRFHPPSWMVLHLASDKKNR